MNTTNETLIFKNYSDLHGTPCYIYSLKQIKENWNKLHSALPNGSDLYYSVKANSHHEIIRFLNESGSHFEVASINEMKTVLDQNVDSKRIIYIAPAKSMNDIEYAIKANIKAIVIDSIIEIDKISKSISQTDVIVDVMFRLNTGIKSPASLSMAGNTQFGLSKNEIINEFKRIKSLYPQINIIGLHCFQGTNIYKESDLIKEFKMIIEEYIDIMKTLHFNPQILDFGGGFSSPISLKDKDLNIPFIETELSKLFNIYKSQLSDSKLAFESGRFIVGNAGYLITQVRDIKKTPKNNFIFVDAGIHCYGGFDRTIKYRCPPIISLDNQSNHETYTICGPSCTPYDIIAEKIFIPEPQIGSIIVIKNVGAYQYSASPGKFLSLGFPIEICFKNASDTLETTVNEHRKTND